MLLASRRIIRLVPDFTCRWVVRVRGNRLHVRTFSARFDKRAHRAHSVCNRPARCPRGGGGELTDRGDPRAANPAFRRVALIVAVLNLAYFGVEFGVAASIRSVSLFADSIDFLEDASVTLLILAALAWTAKTRARIGMLLAAILLVPSVATCWTAWEKLKLPIAPDPAPLSLTALGALAVNFTCALLLARYRHHSGSLTKAAFLSARNDVLGNVAIILAALVTGFLWRSTWPDLIVGLAIALLNADAARDIWEAARQEHRAAA